MEGKALANQIWETLSRAGVAGIVAFVRHCCSVGACGATLRCNEKGRRKVGLLKGQGAGRRLIKPAMQPSKPDAWCGSGC